MGLLRKIQAKKAKVGVVGLGYVGLPLVIEFTKAGLQVTGFDIDPKKTASLNKGKSYIKHIPDAKIKSALKLFNATTDFSGIKKLDCIIVCVPTPLNRHREPDLSYIVNTTREVAKYFRKGQLYCLESTTYPGTTDEVVKPILESNGLKAGIDFHLAFSPEREDPNNPDFTTRTIPKVVGGHTPGCLAVANALYSLVVEKTVPVSSTRVAEATKLLENIYRSVNIALVNELKMLFNRMDIDVWEVIEAASTKPFGFHAFYPGPGLGGHCIPIDPFYLTWKAREFDVTTKFIELAGEINTLMPYYVIQRTIEALNETGKSIKGAKVLVLGLAYKKNVDDARESPSLKLIELLEEKGAKADYNDPHIPAMPKTRKYKMHKKSVPLTPKSLGSYDCVLVSTDHKDYDPDFIARHSKLVVDTRNLVKNPGRFKGKVKRA